MSQKLFERLFSSDWKLFVRSKSGVGGGGGGSAFVQIHLDGGRQ
jgi:hypothetical protein